MESTRIYEESLKELTAITKRLSTSDAIKIISIDFSKLDAETKGALKSAINEVVATRRKSINNLIVGVQ